MTPQENLERLAAYLKAKSAPRIPSNGLRRTTRLGPKTKDKRRQEDNEARHEDRFGPQANLCRLSPCLVKDCRAMPPQEPHHILGRLIGGRDSDCVPLCNTKPGLGREGHHQELHRTGAKTFQRRHQVNLVAIAAACAKEAAEHRCRDWAVMDPSTTATTCGICELPCDAPVGP